MLSSELQSLRVEALKYLEAADKPCHARAVARQLFGARRHEDPVAQLVLRKLLEDEPGFVQVHDGCWAAAAAPHLRRETSDATYAVVDLEATGSLIGVDKIIEVGIAMVRGGEVIDRFSSLIRCSRPVSPHVRRLTGISTKDLKVAPAFADVAPRIYELLASADVFVAHDVWFDLAFLRWELSRLGREMSHMVALCTLRLARVLWPDLDGWRLKDLAARFAVTLDHPHRAGDDALATAGVLMRELDLAAEQGVSDLAGLFRLHEGKDGDTVAVEEDGNDALEAHAAG